MARNFWRNKIKAFTSTPAEYRRMNSFTLLLDNQKCEFCEEKYAKVYYFADTKSVVGYCPACGDCFYK